MQLSRYFLHVLKAVFWVYGWVIGHNGHAINAQAIELAAIGHQARQYRFDIGAMIANEHHQQAFFAHQLIAAKATAIDVD